MIKGLNTTYQSVAFSSQRYDIIGVYPSKEESDSFGSPLYVSIIVKATNYYGGPRTVTLKGELAREFATGFAKLKRELRGDEGDGFQEWRWNDSVLYPYITMWVLKMDAIKYALKVMEVRNT